MYNKKSTNRYGFFLYIYIAAFQLNMDTITTYICIVLYIYILDILFIRNLMIDDSDDSHIKPTATNMRFLGSAFGYSSPSSLTGGLFFRCIFIKRSIFSTRILSLNLYNQAILRILFKDAHLKKVYQIKIY